MKKSRFFIPLAAFSLLFGLVITACGNENQQQSSKQAQEKITVSAANDKKDLILGDKVQLTASVEGVSWASKNTDVATVDANGLVTSVGVGSATISASKDGYKDGTISIRVSLQNIVVTVAEDGKTSLLVGETVQLNADQQGVTWESSDPLVASVANGLVTALKVGSAQISAKKDGFNPGSVAIEVVRPEANLKVDLTVGAEHYSADGWWELPSAGGGMMFAMQQVDGPTPIAQNQSWGQQTEPADTFLGGFGVGDKEIVKFTSSAAGKAELVLNIGNSDAAVLKDIMTIKLNDNPISLDGIELEAHAGDWGNSLEFHDVSLGEVTLATPMNTLEIEMSAANSLFLNELSVYAGQATVALSVPAAKTQIAIADGDREVIVDETIQLTADQTDVVWMSLDEEIATVSDAGVVTGVKMGKVNIRAKKEGFYSAQVEITVNPKPVAGQIIIEAESAPEASSDYQSGGYLIQSDNSGWGGSAVHSGGAYVTYFSMGGGDVDLTLTLTFKATEAKTMVLSIVGNAPASWQGEGSPYVFADSAEITFNETAMTFTDQQFKAASGMSPEMEEIVLGEVAVSADDNTLVFHTTGAAPSIDCFKLSLKA